MCATCPWITKLRCQQKRQCAPTPAQGTRRLKVSTVTPICKADRETYDFHALPATFAYKPVRGICVATRSLGQCAEERAVATSSWRRLAPARLTCIPDQETSRPVALNAPFAARPAIEA